MSRYYSDLHRQASRRTAMTIEKNSSEKKRELYLDFLKSFLIILVVGGHVIQSSDANFDQNLIFRYIYSFHMLAFMFVSGFCCYHTVHSWSFLKRRVVRLLIPFFFWFLISEFVYSDWDRLLPDTGNLFLHPDNGLWFLWALFLGTVLFVLCFQLSRILKLKPLPVIRWSVLGEAKPGMSGVSCSNEARQSESCIKDEK